MNKYDEKVLKVAPKGAVIFELLQKEVRSTKGNIVDFLLDGILSFGSAVKQLETRETYYLIMNENEAKLITMQKDLTISNKNITSAVQIASEKKHFLLDGYKYKLYRKIQ
ncbi:hypothetical protein [Ferdinandcohnia sp. SAFN-114]|uniref:hypothetical protein n=1 Tax=Ferdinandcohnia sp. SAFN-114 TaxID=3387275 RepID=UPI003F80411B